MNKFFMFSVLRSDGQRNQLPHYSEIFGFSISETISTTSDETCYQSHQFLEALIFFVSSLYFNLKQYLFLLVKTIVLFVVILIYTC